MPTYQYLNEITATIEELNLLDGCTNSTEELNLLDGSVAGTVTNSKGVIYGASGEVNAKHYKLVVIQLQKLQQRLMPLHLLVMQWHLQ